jgi:hypothetical protein
MDRLGESTRQIPGTKKPAFAGLLGGDWTHYRLTVTKVIKK